jgi:methylase of polypeptide subunit release factors
MSEKQRRWGQFYTAPEVVDLVLGFCLRRPTDRLLDPSCGEGAFLLRAAYYRRWLSSSDQVPGRPTLWGVEIDAEAAETARAALAEQGGHAHILAEDFFALRPGQALTGLDGTPTELPPAFDCIVGNPPYTRSEWLAQVTDDPGYRDRLIDQVTADLDRPARRINKRAGLYTYFFLHGSKFLRPGGRFGFVASNSWLDVDYGRMLKQFLLDHFRILVIIESAVEQWFESARVNTCVVILERCDEPDGRARNQVRLVRLRQPLTALVSSPQDSPGRAVEVENLVMRLLPGENRTSADLGVRVVQQANLDAGAKWGPLLRAPELYFLGRRALATRPVAEIAGIYRGQTTGANSFFYLSYREAERWGIEDRFLRPLLKSPKEVDHLHVEPADLEQRVLMVDSDPDALANTRVYDYIRWGAAHAIDRRSTCARRSPWYALPQHGAGKARLAWPKGIWNRHFVLMVEGNVVADQQFYVLTVAPEQVPLVAALLNSTWAALQAELVGRCNFGEGVLWLAGYEVAQIRIPDPERLAPATVERLEDAFVRLTREPLAPLDESVARPAQQELDQVVFDLLGFSRSEGRRAVEAALKLARSRVTRAASG